MGKKYITLEGLKTFFTKIKEYISKASVASATNANYATSAGSATKATNDGNNNNIAKTYVTTSTYNAYTTKTDERLTKLGFKSGPITLFGKIRPANTSNWTQSEGGFYRQGNYVIAQCYLNGAGITVSERAEFRAFPDRIFTEKIPEEFRPRTGVRFSIVCYKNNIPTSYDSTRNEFLAVYDCIAFSDGTCQVIDLTESSDTQSTINGIVMRAGWEAAPIK